MKFTPNDRVKLIRPLKTLCRHHTPIFDRQGTVVSVRNGGKKRGPVIGKVRIIWDGTVSSRLYYENMVEKVETPSH